jgi:ankyrin repeat protein
MKSPIFSLVLLTALFSWSAFCGEIHDAVAIGDLEKVKALLKDNPNLVFSKQSELAGLTPLSIAASYNRKEIAEFLLANKAEVNARDDGGYTPLHAAAQRGYVEIVALLLTNKANVNSTNEEGVTPLHTTAWCCSKRDVTDLLLAHGANVNAKTIYGMTPLHVAVPMGHQAIVESLLDHKADPNARTKDGMTPLHLIAEGAEIREFSKEELLQPWHQDFKGVVELLLAHGADINATNNNGDTPLHFAVAKSFKNMEALLRQHGGHE